MSEIKCIEVFMHMDKPWQPQLQCQEPPLQLHHLEQGVSLQPTQPAKRIQLLVY